MKTRLAVLTFLVLVLAFSLIIPASYAYDCGKSKGCSSKGLDDKIFHKAHSMIKNKEKLALTDEQVKRIKDLKIKTKKDRVRKKAEIGLIAIDIKAELWKDPIDVWRFTKGSDGSVFKLFNEGL